MARIRSVKPTFWTDEKVGLLARDVRLTFLGLISAMADDHGRLSGVARIVRGAVYPFDEDISTAEVERHLVEIAAKRLITRYAVNGGQYIHIRNWLRHQKVDKPSPSLIPEPPQTIDDDSPNVRRTLPTERSGRERKGAEGIGSGADGRARDTLPQLVDRFLETFYRGATPERREAVKQQLRATLGEEGARIRRGEFVKARSSAHLADCLRDTIQTGVKDPDKAIVIVLRKLADPEKENTKNAAGDYPTTAEAKRTKADEKAADEYKRQRNEFAEEWGKDHPDEMTAIQDRATVTLGPEVNVPGYDLLHRLFVSQKAAEAGGFPNFETWSAGAAAVA